MFRSSHRRCSLKKVFLKLSQNSQENEENEACNFIKKETLAQVFSFELCDIFKNIFFTEHLRATASAVFKEVRHDCSEHRSAHLFTIAISSHSHIKRKQPQRIFLQYSCSVTMINIVKNICEGNFIN